MTAPKVHPANSHPPSSNREIRHFDLGAGHRFASRARFFLPPLGGLTLPATPTGWIRLICIVVILVAWSCRTISVQLIFFSQCGHLNVLAVIIVTFDKTGGLFLLLSSTDDLLYRRNVKLADKMATILQHDTYVLGARTASAAL
jgi:hypothetical protein